MPRRGKIAKRDVLEDPIYNSKLVTRLINNVMVDGKKGVAQKIVYGAFDIVAEKTGKDALEMFQEAMDNVMPVLEVKARRMGGATYQVPMEVRPERRQTLGLRWITKYSRLRNEKTMKERLAGEILDALNNHYRAYSVLHRYQPQDRRDPRGCRYYGLDGTGAGTWYHNHICCNYCTLGRSQNQHHRHPGTR